MSAMYFLNLADNVGFALIRFIVSLFWQSSIVLLGAFVIMNVLRNHRADVRHRILTAVFLSIPLIPILSWFAGYIGVPQASLFIPPEFATISAESAPTEPLKNEIIQTVYTSSQSEIIPGLFNFPFALTALVLISVGIAMLSIVFAGRRRISLLLRNGAELTDSNLISIFKRGAKRLDLQKEFTLVSCSEIDTPFTSGTRKPVIFLPTEIRDNLSNNEISDIALHELAHIKRYDSLWLTMISVFRAFIFFNPLAWLAAGQILKLTEEACDDMVIRSTGKPVDYARMLTRIAEKLSNRRLIMELSAGIVLSRKAFIKRVRNILSSKGRAVRKFTMIQCTAMILDLMLVFGIAIAAPLNDKTDVKVMKATADKAGLQEKGEILNTGMDLQTVTSILGFEPEIKDVYTPTRDIYVWKEKGFFSTKHTLIVVFENDKAWMISSVTGNVKDINKHVANAEESSRRAKKVEVDGELIPMHEADNIWVDVPHAMKRLIESGEEELVLDQKTIQLFDSIEMKMPFEKVAQLLGEPTRRKINKRSESYIWDFGEIKFKVNLKKGFVLTKELKAPHFNLFVEKEHWTVHGSKSKITVEVRN